MYNADVEYDHCEQIFRNFLQATTRGMRDAIIWDVYFHGEYEQYLSVTAFRDIKLTTIQFEFPVTDIYDVIPSTAVMSTSASQVIRRNQEDKTNPLKALVDYSQYKNYQIKSNICVNDFQENRRQQEINQEINVNYMKVEVGNNGGNGDDNDYTMAIYDLTKPSTITASSDEDTDKPRMFYFDGHRRHYTNANYAFTSDAKYFAYVEVYEDGDQREEPDLKILRMYTWKDLNWGRRRNIMILLAGYGLLKVFNKDSKVVTDELESKISSVLTVDTTNNVVTLVEEEPPSSVNAFFHVFQCPNLLQQIVFYI